MNKFGIDLSTVEKVANLARLKLSGDEMQAIAGQLSAVLKNFEQLAEVDTTGIEPLVTPTDLKVFVREDIADQKSEPELYLANAPARSGNLYKVPPVV